MRRLRRRYGHSHAAFKAWSVHLEMALVPHFERAGASYWVARDVATSTAKGKEARELFKKGVGPSEAAAAIEARLAARRGDY